MSEENRRIGLDWWQEELEQMKSSTLDRLDKLVAKNYIERLLRTLTIDELKKLMIMIKRTRIRRQKTA
jgi:hypothetical protein